MIFLSITKYQRRKKNLKIKKIYKLTQLVKNNQKFNNFMDLILTIKVRSHQSHCLMHNISISQDSVFEMNIWYRDKRNNNSSLCILLHRVIFSVELW